MLRSSAESEISWFGRNGRERTRVHHRADGSHAQLSYRNITDALETAFRVRNLGGATTGGNER